MVKSCNVGCFIMIIICSTTKERKKKENRSIKRNVELAMTQIDDKRINIKNKLIYYMDGTINSKKYIAHCPSRTRAS